MRNTQTVRVLALLFKLCAYRTTGLSIADLCTYSGTNRRTLYRDFDALKEAGVELESVRYSGTLCIRIKSIPGLIDD